MVPTTILVRANIKLKSLLIQWELMSAESDKDISEYNSFNDFFARKLHPRARPVNRTPNGINSPGDGRLLVFPK